MSAAVRQGGPRSGTAAIAVLVAVLFCGLFASCFPPFDVAEAAYVCVLPFLVWSLFRPGRRLYVTTAWLAASGSWFLILIWLRHIHPPFGWLAVTLLAGILGIFPAAWLILARWALPRALHRPASLRLLTMLGLAGGWVVQEWVRHWIFTGCPWLPLAASQWQRPAMLQLAAWTGHYGIGYVLILVNLGLLVYGYSLVQQVRARSRRQAESKEGDARERYARYGAEPKSFFGGFKLSFCPEFYLALAALFSCFALYVFTFKERAERMPMFRAAAVQPWIPATLKWDQAMAGENLRILQQQTEYAALLQPDVILWPEAATPFPLLDGRDDGMLRWVERLATRLETPILAGSLALLDGQLFNGVFWVRPAERLFDRYYLKRRPVPFGEYAPLRQYLPFIGKVVPLANDIVAAEAPVVIPTVLGGEKWPVGVMICNEDIYPSLSRDMALAGAAWLLVVTNDAWYGTEAGAYQHAANSVLRAVETRLPLVRCGNHGWSGWIDEFGHIRYVLQDADGSIYFRGVGPMEVTRAVSLYGETSFYVRHGNWFVGLSGFLLLASVLLLCRRPQKVKS